MAIALPAETHLAQKTAPAWHSRLPGSALARQVALAPEEIIIFGNLTTAGYRFGPMIEEELRRNSLNTSAVLRPAYDDNSEGLRAVAAVLKAGTLQ